MGDGAVSAVQPKRGARPRGVGPPYRYRGWVPSPPLRVAVLAPISWRTPPRHYGPWELFASLLADGLVALGHDVTLFATGDSSTTGRLSATSPRGWSEDSGIDPKVVECLHIAAVFERADEFDVIHNGFDFLPLTYSELVATPVVTTIHGFSSEQIVDVYERYNDSNTYVAISNANRHPRLRYAATVHHGIDVAAFHTDAEPRDHLLFFGRIHPDKGTAAAIAVARAAGRALVIAGIVHDAAYFRSEIEPQVDGLRVQYIGPVAAADRAAVLGSAHALLHLIDFDEPFGFSVAEALVCGTPVIAFDRGSMRELVEDAHDGWLVRTNEEAVAAIKLVNDLDRSGIRASARRRFDARRMASEYVHVYRRALNVR